MSIPPAVSAFAKKNWPCLVAVLVAFFLGGFAGRKMSGGAPDKVTEKSHVESVAKANVIADAKTTSAAHTTVAEVRHKVIRIHTHTEIKPDKSKVIDRTVQIADQTNTNASRGKNVVSTADVADHSQTQHAEDHSKVTEYRRDWKASLLLGAQLANPVTLSANPLSATVAYGVSIDRRLDFIPIRGAEHAFVGLWLMGTTPLSNPVKTAIFAGGQIGVEF